MAMTEMNYMSGGGGGSMPELTKRATGSFTSNGSMQTITISGMTEVYAFYAWQTSGNWECVAIKGGSGVALDDCPNRTSSSVLPSTSYGVFGFNNNEVTFKWDTGNAFSYIAYGV